MTETITLNTLKTIYESAVCHQTSSLVESASGITFMRLLNLPEWGVYSEDAQIFSLCLSRNGNTISVCCGGMSLGQISFNGGPQDAEASAELLTSAPILHSFIVHLGKLCSLSKEAVADAEKAMKEKQAKRAKEEQAKALERLQSVLRAKGAS